MNSSLKWVCKKLKIILISFLFFSLNSHAQISKNYKELNIGFPPGSSFLYGKTTYYKNTLIDLEIGPAFPSVITGKIGVGLGTDNFAFLIGIRPFPLFTYLQINIRERLIISGEISPSEYINGFGSRKQSGDPDYDEFWMEFSHPSMVMGIITVGWRWGPNLNNLKRDSN